MSEPLRPNPEPVAIQRLRAHAVMLDSDLARLYGVTLKQLHQQVQRNLPRFPGDFAFQLTREEWENWKAESEVANGGRRRGLPWVFTDQGALMLASVLNTDVAVEMNVRVVRAMVRLREMIFTDAELMQKYTELNRLPPHEQMGQLLSAIRELLAVESSPERGGLTNG